MPPTAHDRHTLGQLIAAKITASTQALRQSWLDSSPVKHVIIQDLLPPDLAADIASHFPPASDLLQRSSLRERKKVGIELQKYNPVIGELTFAFQEPAVIAAVEAVTGMPQMSADPTLYASGISLMAKDDFLNPHLDNSHDGDRKNYRVINLLYYVSQGWSLEQGGNLELWDDKVTKQTTVVASFNRLVLMKTDRKSWHSVSRVTANAVRLCVSNYYFSPVSPDEGTFSHVTTFAGRPEEPIKRIVLKADGIALNALGKAFPSLLKRTKHRIEPDQPPKPTDTPQDNPADKKDGA
jgi:Rps23 Pro-64 3,4-dihydroxylase Tpa1-like proline 4-hydroxylase